MKNSSKDIELRIEECGKNDSELIFTLKSLHDTQDMLVDLKTQFHNYKNTRIIDLLLKEEHPTLFSDEETWVSNFGRDGYHALLVDPRVDSFFLISIQLKCID